MIRDAFPLNVLHHQERPAVFRDATIEQAGDSRVVQRCQDLTLVPETRDHIVRVESTLHDLQRDAALELPVASFGAVGYFDIQ